MFYIDHLSNTHHRHHPRVETERKQAQLDLREQQASDESAKRLRTLKELREKRRRLHGQLTSAADDQSRNVLRQRVMAIDLAIEAETQALEAAKNSNNALLAVVNRLRKKKDPIVAEKAAAKMANVWLKKVRA